MTAADLLTLRTTLGFSKAALARQLHVHVTTIYRWECGLRKIPEPAALYLLTLRGEATVAETPPTADSRDDRESRRPPQTPPE